jgi:hypothetical protein
MLVFKQLFTLLIFKACCFIRAYRGQLWKDKQKKILKNWRKQEYCLTFYTYEIAKMCCYCKKTSCRNFSLKKFWLKSFYFLSCKFFVKWKFRSVWLDQQIKFYQSHQISPKINQKVLVDMNRAFLLWIKMAAGAFKCLMLAWRIQRSVE